MIGAVQKAVVGYYDSRNRKYENIDFNKPMEVLNLPATFQQRTGSLRTCPYNPRE